MKVKEIDKNFQPATEEYRDLIYFQVNPTFRQVEGLPWFYETGSFDRVKQEIAEHFHDTMQILCRLTSGGCLRFVTDSPTIAIQAKLKEKNIVANMTRIGSSGFDLYVRNGEKQVYKAYAVSEEDSLQIDSVMCRGLGENKKEITIYFPIFSGIESLSVGVENGYSIQAPPRHRSRKPIVFYGSSITEGGCASHPGNTYTAMIGRNLDAEIINFGFSGSAKGESEVAELIAGLDMGCFVLDYDYNAPSPEHLRDTHRRFFEIIRRKHPNLPIIIMSKGIDFDSQDDKERRSVIWETYELALRQGDRNVYFIDGRDFFTEEEISAVTVDCCHPNDLGFFRMARVVSDKIKGVKRIYEPD